MTIIPVLVILAFVGVGIAWVVHGRRQWLNTAKALGLSFSEESFWLQWRLDGHVRGCSVRLCNVRRDRQSPIQTQLTVQPNPSISTGVTIRMENLKSRAMKLVVGQDVLLGDKAFDGAVWMDGPPVELFGLLDARTRGVVTRVLSEWKIEVQGGAIHYESRVVAMKAAKMQRLILDAVALADRLRPPVDGYPPAVIRNLAREESVGIRTRALGYLLDGDPDWVLPAARVGMQDADPSIRLKSALAAGAEGVQTLEDALTWGTVTEEDGSALLAALRTQAPDRFRAQLDAVIQGTPTAVTGPAIRLAGEMGLREYIPRFNRLADKPSLQPALVDAIRLFGDPSAEAALVAALGHSDPGVRRRAADALGHFGTRAAVPPLRAVQDRATRGVATEAIARIANREAPGRGGGLSVVDDGVSGGLSTTSEAGALSETGKDT